MEFQSTLPNGSDEFILWFAKWYNISIHAPKRERLIQRRVPIVNLDFNPRSQTGATHWYSHH